METITGIWRHPVKSMAGESVDAMPVTAHGVLGDRRHALIDVETGKIASAKNLRRWPGLLSYAAAYTSNPRIGSPLPAVRIRLPSHGLVMTDDPDVDALLSRALDRKVTVSSSAPVKPQLEEYWPDLEELDHQDTLTDEPMPSGTFFDLASVHLLTTGTLARLEQLYPQGHFSVSRFRPNLLVDTGEEARFVENGWIGRTVRVGDELRLRVTGGCPRCVMTTLEQPGLPKDTGILRTAARYNEAHVGVYAEVIRHGLIRRGDSLRLE